jgi:sugar O-acyltransferase (sialic acid O-acetyltransferase NeuD family)
MLAKDGRILIFGCGGHSRSVASVLLASDASADLVFVDPRARPGEKIYGFAVVSDPPLEESRYFFALGDNSARKEQYDKIGAARLISIVSSHACIGHEVRFGKGLFIGNFCHIGPEVAIGDNTIINNGAFIEHEVSIGSHSHVAPNATISGRCQMGDLVFIGVGAVVKDGIKICSNVTVGAGAVVVKDIVEPGTYIGCPAKKVYENCRCS